MHPQSIALPPQSPWAWPRYRRIRWTAQHNPNYRHGRYTRRRRRLEAWLNQGIAWYATLTPVALLRLSEPARRQAQELASALAEAPPLEWALADSRQRHGPPRWYLPRASWTLCSRWLRLVFRLRRLLTAARLIPRLISPTTQGRKGEKGEEFAQQKQRVLATFWATVARERVQ